MLAIVVSGLLGAPLAQATNGYFAHGYSTKEKGLAGAGVAYSMDSMAAATNPAGMAFVGERMDIGLALFSPSDRSYNVTGTPPPVAGQQVIGPGPACNPIFQPFGPTGPCAPPFSVEGPGVTSENDIFLIPQFGYNWQMSSKSTVGISIYGNGGMDTEYKGGSAQLPQPAPGPSLPVVANVPGTFGDGAAGVQLAQLFFNLSYSYKLDNDQAVGASIIFGYQQFSAFGLGNFAQFSLDPNNLSGNTNSYASGFGFKLGYQGKVMDNLSLGVSYQTEINMSEFDEYSGLFAEGGDFDVPSTYTVGLMYDMDKAGKAVLDIQRINYTDVAAVSNPISRLTDGSCVNALNANLAGQPQAAFGGGCLGGANGAGFGWDDITIIKLGYEMMAGNNTYRFGISKSEQPIPNSETLFNILAPAVIEIHVTFGMTVPVGKDQEFNLAVMIAPSESVSGPNPFDGGATNIEIEMEQKELQVGYAWMY